MRGLIPIAAGAASGFGWWLHSWTAQVGSFTLVQGVNQFLRGHSEIADFHLVRDTVHSLWQLTGLILAWELRWEIRALAWYLITMILFILHWIYLAFIWLGGVGFPGFGNLASPTHQQLPRTERGPDLTCMAAAIAPAAGGGGGAPPFPVGSFLLIARPPDWDEVWLASYTTTGDAVCRTTDAAGGDWVWVVVKLAPLHVKAPMVAPDGSRRAPAGLDANSINWIYAPPDCAQWWAPDAVEIVGLTQEAGLICNHLSANPGSVVVNTAGVGGPLVPFALGPQGVMGPGGAGVQGGGQNQGAAGLGLGGGEASPSAAEIKALEAAVQQLQALAITDKKEKKRDRSRKGSKKDRKRSRDHKKSKKKKKSKKSRKSSSSTSSSYSTSRSRSRTSSSSSRSKKPLVWKESGKDKGVSFSHLSHVEQLRFKKKGDLINFAARHPGALTAHFLAGVYARLSKGTISRSSQLRDVSVTAWAHQFAGLTEVRDMKEVVTLAEILDHVNRREISRALDVLCQRILAIQSAKGKGGSWEKAENLELVNTQKSLAPSSMLALTNA